jgi:hypothetical protein
MIEDHKQVLMQNTSRLVMDLNERIIADVGAVQIPPVVMAGRSESSRVATKRREYPMPGIHASQASGRTVQGSEI